jgi:predicted MFS family arabinose efflux permease
VSGGVLTEASWRYTFAVVVPAAAVLLLAALRVVPNDEPVPAVAGRRLDVGGAVTVTGAALLFVYAVVKAPTVGWLSVQTLGGLTVAAALLGAFVVIERTVERPLVRLGLLRSPRLVRACVGALLLFGCATVFNVVNTLYEQNVLGWGPLKTGSVFMVASITTGVLAPRAGAIATRVGAMWVVLAGALAMAASYLVFLATGTTTSYPVIVTSLVLMGAAFALAHPALNIEALAGVADEEQGLAAGLVGSSFQIGGAVVLAIATAVILAHTPAHPSGAQAVHGLHGGMLVAVVGASLIVLVATMALLRGRRRRPAHHMEALDQAV